MNLFWQYPPSIFIIQRVDNERNKTNTAQIKSVFAYSVVEQSPSFSSEQGNFKHVRCDESSTIGFCTCWIWTYQQISKPQPYYADAAVEYFGIVAKGMRLFYLHLLLFRMYDVCSLFDDLASPSITIYEYIYFYCCILFLSISVAVCFCVEHSSLHCMLNGIVSLLLVVNVSKTCNF